MITDAYISEDGLYRYWLKRQWGQGDPIIFIMLNPSTADANKDDATIRRCIGYAKYWGQPGILILNLFAYRTTNPENLFLVSDPVGPENEDFIRLMCANRSVICAWGSVGTMLDQDRTVEGWLREVNARTMMLAETAAGVPRHPLYLRKNLIPTNYKGRSV